MVTITTDYRHKIAEIANRYTRPGDDWESALFDGAPAVIGANEARRIADWLDQKADGEWGEDERHHIIADEIRSLFGTMRETRVTGQSCVGDLRLAAIDVGFDLRAHGTPVRLPEAFESVGLDRDGETYLIQGTRDEMIDAIRAAGYAIAD